jgi:hypothetical protein
MTPCGGQTETSEARIAIQSHTCFVDELHDADHLARTLAKQRHRDRIANLDGTVAVAVIVVREQQTRRGNLRAQRCGASAGR